MLKLLALVAVTGCQHTCNHQAQPTRTYLASGGCGRGGSVTIGGRDYQPEAMFGTTETCIGPSVSDPTVLGFDAGALAEFNSDNDQSFVTSGFYLADQTHTCALVPMGDGLQMTCRWDPGDQLPMRECTETLVRSGS